MRAAGLATAYLAAFAGPAALSAVATPPNGGTISIEQASGNDADKPTSATIDAIGGALAERGFTILNDSGHAANIAEWSMTRTDVGTGSARIAREREAIVPGGLAGVGAGVTVPLSGSNTRAVPLRRVQLEIRIRKRGQNNVLWRGAAVTVRAAGTRQGADDVVAADLSEAILRNYPHEVSGIISIP